MDFEPLYPSPRPRPQDDEHGNREPAGDPDIPMSLPESPRSQVSRSRSGGEVAPFWELQEDEEKQEETEKKKPRNQEPLTFS